jgi:NTP pyrophosphatase (non-canonical NTP hydrolase)
MMKEINMNLDQLTKLIEEWGEGKGILPNPNPIAQFKKTQEEVNELLEGIKKEDLDEIKDAIGDIFVTLVMQTNAWNISMNECVQGAYDVIKQRTGKMVNGQFVKDAD